MNLDFKLCAGTWEYWFYDKETHEILTSRQYIGTLISNKTEVKIEVPKRLQENKNAVIKIQRTR